MLNNKYISVDSLGIFRKQLLASSIQGLDSATPVPEGTIAKSYAIYYVQSGSIYLPADPQPAAGSSIPANTYYLIGEGSPDDVTRAPSVRAVVQYVDSVIEEGISGDIDKKVSGVYYDASTKKLYYTNGEGSTDIVTLGDNAFTSTAIPTTYIKDASKSNDGKTLTLTKADGTTTVTYAPDTTYTFGEGSTNGTISVTPSGGSASDVAVKGLKSAAYQESSAFLGASAKAASSEVADAVAWSGVTSKPTTLSGYGITDANISNGTITLGENTITPVTEQYVHPTTDGNKHVPATGTTSDGKVLVAGSTAGSASWKSLAEAGIADAGHNHDTAYLGISAKAASSSVADAVPLSGVTDADDLKAIEGLSGNSGFLKKTAANTWTLDTNTYNNYTHPTTTAHTAAAVKVGNDSEGHVVLGDALTAADVGAASSSHNHDTAYLGISAKAASASTADAVALSGVTDADDLKAIEVLSGTSGFLKKTAANTWTLDTNTYNNYVHPTTTAHTAAAVKIGNDSEGHVVIGDALTAADVGAAASGHNHDSAYLGISAKAASASTADAVDWSGVNSTPTTIAGYGITDAKIDNGVITLGANTITPVTKAYTHPTGDGNLHVPATSTTSNGKVLVAGSTAGSASWKSLADAGIASSSHNHDSAYLGISAKAASASSADAVALAGVTDADDLKAIEALSGTSGFLKKTAANTWTLDTNTYNNYSHPTGDGNHHVPATGTTNNGKVLVAGSTAGSEAWKTLAEAGISATSHNHDTTYLGISAKAASASTADAVAWSNITNKPTDLATESYVTTQIDNKIAAADAMIYKGTIGTGGTVTTLPSTTAKTGWTYKVITAGDYAGQTCEIGDMIICLTDGSASTAATWTVVQNNVDGAVTGPASSTDGQIAVFNGATGKVIKSGGKSVSDFLGKTEKAASASTADAVALAGVTDADDLKAIEALSGTAGFLKKTAANTWTLDNSTYNNYSHPTSDGNKHVPATGTTSNGKVLVAGSTAGAFSWKSLADAGISATSHNHDSSYLGISAKAASASTADAVAWSGVSGTPTTLAGYGITDAASSTHNHDTKYLGISAKAASASSADSVAWSGVTDTPTTLAGYGITDAASSGHNHDSTYLGISAKAASASSADAVALSGVTGADDLKAIEALSGTAGFLKKTAANTWTLDNSTYNNYSHPTSDGNKHVPATGTTSNGKVLVAGSTAGSFSWKSLADAGISATSHNHDTAYLGISAKAASASSADAVALSGVSDADDLKAIEALTGTAGFLKKTAANTWTLDNSTYNNYSHPTTDGNKHVPATGTNSNGKVLVAGSTAGTFSWKSLSDAGIAASGHNHDSAYLGISAKAASASSADAVALSGVTGADDLKAIEALTGTAGFLKKTAANKWTLDNSTYNNYSHPTGDGNLHVPATGTGSNGKVLVAGSTAGSASWKTLADAGIAASGHNHNSTYLGISAKAASATTADSASSVALSGVTDADDLKAIEALTGTSGFLKKTAANQWTLDTNTYLTSHQSLAGYVPTSRTVNGKELSSNITLNASDVGASATDTTNTAGGTNSTNKLFIVGMTSQADGNQTYTNTNVYTTNGSLYASAVYNAVWNDLTDRIPVDDECELEYGKYYCFDGEHYYQSNAYCPEGMVGIHSDTGGFEMGHKEGVKELQCSVAGFVLAYVDREYPVGTPLTATCCGYLTEISKKDKMEYPERIVATYWKDEPAEYWGSDDRKVKVNGRKWVKIK